MELHDELKCMIGAYFGIEKFDQYELKEYVLNDLKILIDNFMSENNLNQKIYEEQLMKIEKNNSFISNLQDCLIILPRINAKLELMMMIRQKIQSLQEK